MWEKYHEPSNYVECSKLLSKYIHKGHNLSCYRFIEPIEPIKTYQCCLRCCKHVLFGHSLGGGWLVYHFLSPVSVVLHWKFYGNPDHVHHDQLPGTDATNAVGLSFLVGALEHFVLSIQLGMSSSQLTLFFRGVGQPPTSNPYQMITLRFINSITSCSPERAGM